MSQDRLKILQAPNNKLIWGPYLCVVLMRPAELWGLVQPYRYSRLQPLLVHHKMQSSLMLQHVVYTYVFTTQTEMDKYVQCKVIYTLITSRSQ
jgi:hypothetical protein